MPLCLRSRSLLEGRLQTAAKTGLRRQRRVAADFAPAPQRGKERAFLLRNELDDRPLADVVTELGG